MTRIHKLPISIKGVVVVGDRVLLAKNERDEWELLGGRIELAEHPRETLAREIWEEASLVVEISASPIDTYVFDVLEPQGKCVFIVTYGCVPLEPDTPFAVSAEHRELSLFLPGTVNGIPNLPAGYKASIQEWTRDCRR